MRVLLLLAACWMASSAQTPPAAPKLTADEIMSRVAENQDRAERARVDFVYHQNVVIRLRDTRGRLTREEISDYEVTPQSGRTHKQLVKFAGRYRADSGMESYIKSGEGSEDGFRNEADGHMAHNLRDNLTGSEKSKDGLSPQLFPLTAKEQRNYHFTLKGEEIHQGVPVYRINFQPKGKDYDDAIWKGEALIGKQEFQPVLVITKLAHGIPLWVRTALGTNLPGLGFSVEYRKFADSVWFPVSYGTEFRVHVLFVYSRNVSISMSNSDFRRADVETSVEFDPVK